MKKTLAVFFFALAVLLLGGQFSAPIQRASLQRELETLKQQGLSYKFLDNKTIEVSEEPSGLRRIKTLNEPSEAEIRAWAAARNVPILEIDPTTIDTNRFTGWFKYRTTLPLSNGFGSPLIVGDIDRNGKPEVYGIFKSYTSDFESHIYEVDSSGILSLLYNYVPRLGPSRQFVNVDNDSLAEIVFAFGIYEYDFEQTSPTALPTAFKLRVARDSVFGSIFTGIFIGDLDNNGLTDFVNTGGIPDSASGQPLRKVFVKEFDSTRNSFATIWSSQFDQPLGNYGGFTAGDFDGDGKQEFQFSEIAGKVYVVEAAGIHSYATTWRDSTPFVNLFYQTSGDLDRDSKPEFYVGATMSNGNWTTMYEADSNDHYSPRLIFHLLSGGSLDEPTYLTPDVDQDGRRELLILSGADLYVFKSNANDSFYLWYYRRFTAKESIRFYDFNHDGKQDFILSRARQDSLFRLSHFADIYLAQRFTGVELDLVELPDMFTVAPNFPNPFNPSTRIQYSISNKEHVRLEVFDVTGKRMATLVDDVLPAGSYNAEWSGHNTKEELVSSGVYLCRLSAGNRSQTIKMVLIR